MGRTVSLAALCLFAGLALSSPGAQQQPIKRTDLLKAELAEIKDGQMSVWVADVAPGAATGRHTHPTPRFVYVLEGAVVLEMDGRPTQTFKAGQAFVEMPNQVHNFKNASTTESARALGFQYGTKGQPLQTNTP
jgi:quercetin dioxygenase-like cupin family protein